MIANTQLTRSSTPSSSTLARIEHELHRDPRLKSPNTQRGYRHDLAAFEDWRQGRTLTKLLVEEYAAQLQNAGRAPSTINRILAAVRWWARRLGDLAFEDLNMDSEHRQEITTQTARVAAVTDVRGARAPKGRHVASGEIGALLAVCAADPSPAGARDAALLALGWATGARRSELAGLQLADFTPTGEDHDGDLTIRGKGDKVRTLYIYDGAAAYLADWLALRGGDPGPLFYAINKAGSVQGGHGVSDEALAQMLAKRIRQAKVKTLTWHDLRRTFAGNLLDQGVDLVTVQKLMGHSSPTTTSNYDRRGEDVKRKAVRTLHVPYTARWMTPR